MEIANAAPIGVLAFAVACLCSGMFFFGIDNDPPETTGLSVAIIQIFCGLMLTIVAILFILGNQPGGPAFSLWAAAVFGFFAYVWFIMGFIILKGGDFRPLSTFIVFTCACCAVWCYETFTMGLMSFGILFVFATLGTFLAWIGIRGWWAQGAKWAGACFIVLGFIGFYIGIVEMMHRTMFPPAG
ncbi:hypothetical protein ACFL9U_03210 [Thermodesulfobacteriota bacterium]